MLKKKLRSFSNAILYAGILDNKRSTSAVKALSIVWTACTKLQSRKFCHIALLYRVSSGWILYWNWLSKIVTQLLVLSDTTLCDRQPFSSFSWTCGAQFPKIYTISSLSWPEKKRCIRFSPKFVSWTIKHNNSIIMLSFILCFLISYFANIIRDNKNDIRSDSQNTTNNKRTTKCVKRCVCIILYI